MSKNGILADGVKGADNAKLPVVNKFVPGLYNSSESVDSLFVELENITLFAFQRVFLIDPVDVCNVAFPLK